MRLLVLIGCIVLTVTCLWMYWEASVSADEYEQWMKVQEQLEVEPSSKTSLRVSKTDERLSRLQQERNVVVILIMKTTVDQKRYRERLLNILNGFGRRAPMQRLYDYRIRFVSGSKPPEGVLDHDMFYVVDEDKGKTINMVDGLQLARQEFGDKLHWVLKCDENVFIILENLERLLALYARYDPRTHMFHVGNRLAGRPASQDLFHSGGAGFLLSRMAIDMFLDLYWPKSCVSKYNSEYFLRSEDVTLTRCLKRHAMKNHLLKFDAAMENNMDLFSVFEPITALTGKEDQWYKDYKQNAYVTCCSCCSSRTISFHYVEGPLAKFLYQTIYEDLVIDSIDDWPKELGGYARRPKSMEDLQLFYDLMERVKKSIGMA